MPALYNHSHFPVAEYAAHSADKYRDMVQYGGLHSLRALPCTKPEDVIQLDPRLRDSYPYAAEHLGELGLDTASEVIWDTSLEAAKELPDHSLSVYNYGEAAFQARPDQAWRDIAAGLNDKNIFVRFCAAAGYAVPPTYMVDRDKADDLGDLQLPAYVKAARSSAGVSIYRVANNWALKKAMKLVGDNYQVQEEVADVLAFLNVQYQAVGNKALHLATTEQVLDGFTHIGNRHPSAHSSRHLTDSLAERLITAGMKDVFAFDVAVTPDDMRIIECNARWNGSTYPTMLAQRLGIEEWTAYSLDTGLEHPKNINLGSLAYDAASRYGAVVANTSLMASHRKVGVLAAGPAEAQPELQAGLSAALAADAELTQVIMSLKPQHQLAGRGLLANEVAF